MTDLIALAVSCMTDKPSPGPSVILCPESLKAFAELVRQDEREALAKLFETHWRERWVDWEIADVIRARTTT